MYLECPDYIPKLPDVPDALPIHEFLFEEDHGRHPTSASQPPFVCGLTAKSFSVSQVKERVELLARALSSSLGWQVNEGSEMDKVVGVFTINTIDTLTVSWATHRLNGVSCPISPTHTVESLAQQLRTTGCKALFTCAPLIHTALEAAASVGIPERHVFVLEVPESPSKGAQIPKHLRTVDQLIDYGRRLVALPKGQWSAGQGARQTAFLMSSSGTTGFPKNACVTHQNVIANILQFSTFEITYRTGPQKVLNVLPLSHILALIVVAHVSVYRGDGIVMMPGFDLHQSLSAMEKHKVEILWATPPHVFAFTAASSIVRTYDLQSVKGLRVGAAALDGETLERFQDLMPGCDMIQGYGLTEAGIVTATHRDDVLFGSCGYPLPGFQLRLLDSDGRTIAEHDRPGELVIRGPSIAPEYYGEEAATKDMSTSDGWFRTGDLVEFRKSSMGYSHVFVIDRIKELIKVNSLQVAPAEIEAILRSSRLVSDVAVVPISHDRAGEVPRAYIVKSSEAEGVPDQVIQDELHEVVTGKLPPYKWIAGGIAFLSALPKTASGKVRRDLVKKMARDHYERKKKESEKACALVALQASMQVHTFDSDEDDEK